MRLFKPLLATIVPLAALAALAGPAYADVTLRLAIWDANQKPAIEEIMARFTEQNPGINVSLEVVPRADYVSKLETSIVGKNAPDVFWNALPDRFIDLSRNGLIENLSERMKADPVDLSPIAPALLQAFTYNGSLYAIPKDFDTVGLWYNKALFDAAGVAYPDDSWTWQTLRDAAIKLTDPTNGVYGFVVNAGTRAGYYNFIAQNGGEVLTEANTSGFDMPETVAAIQFMADLILVDKVSPTVQQQEEVNAQTRFKTGKAAMVLDGSWRAREFADDPYTLENADVAVLPQGVKRASSSGTLGYSIYSGSQHKDEAWAFLKFLASPEAADIQASFGAVIPSHLDKAKVWADAIPQYNLQAFLDMVDYAEVVAHSGNTPAWASPMNQELKKALAGDIPVDEAARTVAAKMNEVLAAEGK
jgi:multiple sugar transport system substrate-binding protein